MPLALWGLSQVLLLRPMRSPSKYQNEVLCYLGSLHRSSVVLQRTC